MNGTAQYLSFCNWLISLSVIPSRFLQVTSCDKSPYVHGWTVFRCIYAVPDTRTSHLLYPFTSGERWAASTFCEHLCEAHGVRSCLCDPALSRGVHPGGSFLGGRSHYCNCSTRLHAVSLVTVPFTLHPRYTRLRLFHIFANSDIFCLFLVF